MIRGDMLWADSQSKKSTGEACVCDGLPMHSRKWKRGSAPQPLREPLGEVLGPRSCAQVAHSVNAYGRRRQVARYLAEDTAKGSMLETCRQYFAASQDLFSADDIGAYFITFDGARLGKKETLWLALASPGVKECVWAPPQAGSIASVALGENGLQGGVLKTGFSESENGVFSTPRKK